MDTLKNREPVVAVSVEDGHLIDAFVTGVRSAKTRSNYRANLRAWCRWTAQIGIGELEAERGHVEAYVCHLEQSG